MDRQRTRGAISAVGRQEDRRLEGAFHRYRTWEASVGIDNDQSWAQRMEFTEWEASDRVSTTWLAFSNTK